MAGAALRLRTNKDEVFRDLDAFVAEAKTRAGARTLNVLEGQAQVAGFRVISDRYGIGPRVLEKYATTRLATPANLEATISVKGRGFPLAEFRPIPTPAGVSAFVKGRRHLYPGTFMATMPNGHRGVFARGAYGGKGATAIRETGRIGNFVLGRGKRVRKANKWGVTELPVNELYSSSPADMFADQDVVDAMLDRVEEQAPIVMRREIAAIKRGF